MGSNKSKLAVLLVVAVSLIAVGSITLMRNTGGEVGAVRQLPDGSTLKLAQVVFGTNYTYEHYKTGNQIASFVMPIRRMFPNLRLFPHRGGSFTMGTFPGDTNLFVVTVNRHSTTNWWSALGRVTVFDEQGNSFDPCWDVKLLNGNGWGHNKKNVSLRDEIVNGWWIKPFPRRGKTLGLRFYFEDATSGRWGQAAEFRISNPAYKQYPQWTPEPVPAVSTNGNVQVTLKEFQTGIASPIPGANDDDQTVPRKTRAVFEFSQNGQPVNDCVIQKIAIADATGNSWWPYYSSVPGRNEFARATNGVVEFLGALWPGENAWKLEVEFIRTSGFSRDEFWEVPPLQIPADGHISNLTNKWESDGMTVELVGLFSSISADRLGSDTRYNKLSFRVSPYLPGRQLSLIRATDESGRNVEILNKMNSDYFLVSSEDAHELRLTFALHRSLSVQFLARPDFVRTGDSNVPAR